MIKSKFEGVFANDSQIKSIPIQLLTLISMLVDGTNGFSEAALTSTQILKHDFRKCDKAAESKRHNLKERETPVVIYYTLKLYATVRSRVLIDHVYSLGICLSYQRVLDITKNLYNSTKKQFYRDNALVPGVLRKGIFTVMAKNNIDLNAKSTIITSHYHGTSISVFQYPS